MREARNLPGAEVRLDRDGVESRRFGAETSGAVRVYSPDGRLVFSGGLTSARGHEGDSEGTIAIAALLAGTSSAASSPTFGCPLASRSTP